MVTQQAHPTTTDPLRPSPGLWRPSPGEPWTHRKWPCCPKHTKTSLMQSCRHRVQDAAWGSILVHTGLGLRAWRADSAFSMSENFVAPSASAIRMSFPLQIMVPFNGANGEQQTRSAPVGGGTRLAHARTAPLSPCARRLPSPGSSPES